MRARSLRRRRERGATAAAAGCGSGVPWPVRDPVDVCDGPATGDVGAGIHRDDGVGVHGSARGACGGRDGGRAAYCGGDGGGRSGGVREPDIPPAAGGGRCFGVRLRFRRKRRSGGEQASKRTPEVHLRRSRVAGRRLAACLPAAAASALLASMELEKFSFCLKKLVYFQIGLVILEL